jgi:cytochrome c553
MTRLMPAAWLALALASAAPAAFAQETSTAATLAGDAERGRSLAYTCVGCHGIEGYKNAYPNYHVPMIGGQASEYLVNALTEYRNGTRKHPTMQAQAQSFTEQDIADIAAFLSGLKK